MAELRFRASMPFCNMHARDDPRIEIGAERGRDYLRVDMFRYRIDFPRVSDDLQWE